MPAKITSLIAWKSERQKKRAKQIANKAAGSLSAHIQQLYDKLTDPAPAK